jgi:hypothetical protein
MHAGHGTVAVLSGQVDGVACWQTMLGKELASNKTPAVLSPCSISDDIGVDLVNLSMLSEAVIPAFVPRLGDNKGMLPVRLKLTGARGLPGSADIQVGSQILVATIMLAAAR